MPDTLLHALGGMLLEAISAESLLLRIVEVMREVLQADRGTIFLVDGDGRELVSVRPLLPGDEHIRVPLDRGVAGYVARTGSVVNIPFCRDDQRFSKKVDQASASRVR